MQFQSYYVVIELYSLSVNVIVIVNIDLESSYIENCCQCESINVATCKLVLYVSI